MKRKPTVLDQFLNSTEKRIAEGFIVQAKAKSSLPLSKAKAKKTPPKYTNVIIVTGSKTENPKRK